MSHTKSSESSSGHYAVPLELQNSSEVHLLLTFPAYDCPQTTFAVPHKPSAWTCRKHITWSLSTVVLTSLSIQKCLPSHCLDMGCITLLFYCSVRVMQGVYRVVAWQCVDMTQYEPSLFWKLEVSFMLLHSLLTHLISWFKCLSMGIYTLIWELNKISSGSLKFCLSHTRKKNTSGIY
jgi:hypothetical protein